MASACVHSDVHDINMGDVGSGQIGLIIVDVQSGATVEWLRFEHTVDELYDVAVLAGVVQSEAVGFKGDTIAQTILAEV